MAYQAAVGSFIRRTGTGTQTVTGIVDKNGNPFTGKVMYLWGTYQTAVGLTDEFIFHYGFDCVGGIDVGFFGRSGDNLATMDVRRGHKDGMVVFVESSSGTNIAEASVVSYGNGEFTLDWVTNDGVQSVINYIVLGGDDLEAMAEHLIPSGSPGGNHNEFFGINFVPKMLLLAGGVPSSLFADSDEFLTYPCQGFATAPDEQGGSSVVIQDASADSNSFAYQRSDDHIIPAMRSGAGGSTPGDTTTAGHVKFVEFPGESFTVNWNGSVVPTSLYYLVMTAAGLGFKVGKLTQPAATGLQEIALPGAPLLVILQTAGKTSHTTPQAGACFAFGASNGVTERASVAADKDNEPTSINARATRSDCTLEVISPAATGSSSTTVAKATMDAFGGESFTLDWTVTDGVAREILYLAIYTPAEPELPDPEVETLPATGIRGTQARIRGRINPNGNTLTGRFAWGLDPDALSVETLAQSIGSGTAFIAYSALLEDLTPETTYYYRAIGDAGGSPDVFGEILSFTTLAEAVFIDGEVSFPLTYLEVTHRDEQTKAYAEVHLNDPPNYHFGYKPPWVMRWLPTTRGLSDRSGQITHSAFGALFSDTMRHWRALLEDPVNKFLTNRPLAQWFIDDEDRRVQGPARLAALGYVNDYAPRENLQFELRGSDWLRKKFSRKRRAQQSWQPLITPEDFENCPDDRVNTAAPIVLGSLGLSGADPVDDVQMTVNPQPSAAPAGFAISTVAGGRLAGVRRYYRLAAIVSGQESIQTDTLTAITDNTNKTIRLQWTTYGGSESGLVLFSSDKPNFSHFAYTLLPAGATSYDDDTTPPNQDANWLAGTDWLLGRRLNLMYFVYALLADGTYSRPGQSSLYAQDNFIAPISKDPSLQDRDIDITWAEHPLAVGYRVVRRKSYYSDWTPVFDRQWDVGTGSPLMVTDDVVTTTAVTVPSGELIAAAAAGQVEAINVGPMEIGSPAQSLNWLLVSRCACKRVGKIYLPVTTENVDGEQETTYQPIAESEFGSTWFAPEHAGWLFPTKYVDLNGRRYTLIATTLDPLPEKVLVDVDGIESDGDGEGELLTNPIDQRLWFMNNWLAPDTPYQSGAYLTAADTTFPHQPTIPLVDEASHAAVKAAMAERLEGGYETAFIIGPDGAFVSALDVLAQIQVSGDFDQSFNRKGQDSVSIEPIAPSEDPEVISDIRSIVEGSFSLVDHVQNEFFNIHSYVHTRDYTGRARTGWYGSGEERSQTSIDNYDQERELKWELHCCRSNTPQGAATIADVMARKRARFQDPLRTASFIVPFSGLNFEPGSTAAVDHIEGIGPSGWDNREVRFSFHAVEPTGGFVRLDVYDLTKVFENQGSP